MTASLPMYDTPLTRGANDRLWTLIREAYGHGPETLDRDTDPHVTWRDKTLILSQTCSLPYRSALHGHVKLVGTPDYCVPGCPPGYYRSCVVVRADEIRQDISEFAQAILARNDVRSQSGWAAIEGHLLENTIGFSFLGRTLDTGGHAASAQAVRQGHADIAALDAVTWALFKRENAQNAGQLRVLFETRPTPGLPFVAAVSQDAPRLFEAIAKAIDGLSGHDRERLMLNGIVAIPAQEYLNEPLPPE